MGNEMSGLWKALVKARRSKASWLRAVSLLSAGALFCTVSALMLPARTLSPEPICGLTEHTHGPECYETRTVPVLNCSPVALGLHVHSGSCYDSQGNLCCGQADFVIHTHDASCYDEHGSLVCGLPEIREHVHGPECYGYKDQLICGEEEYPAHTHGPECYETRQVLICDQDHEHTEDCYITEKILICTQREGPGHVHGPECWKQEPVLICDRPEIIAHTHDSSCYDESGNCICGLPEVKVHVHDESCFRLQEQQILVCGLEEHTHGPDCYPEKTEQPPETGVPEGEPATPGLPARVLTAQLSGVTVTVTGPLPEEVTLLAEPVEVPELPVVLALDIRLILPDGTVYQPEDQALTVSILSPEIGADADGVCYLPPEGQPEPVPARIQPGSAEFETNHFAIYVLTREAPQSPELILSKTALEPLPTRAGEPISYRLELAASESFTGEPGAVYAIRDDLGPGQYLTMGQMQSLLTEAASRDLNLEIRIRDALITPNGSEPVQEEPSIAKTTANSCRDREVLSDLVITLNQDGGQRFRVRAEALNRDDSTFDLSETLEDGLGYGVTDSSRYILTWTTGETPFRLAEPLTISYRACTKDPMMMLTQDRPGFDQTVTVESAARLDRILNGDTVTLADSQPVSVNVSCTADFHMEVSIPAGEGWEPLTEGFRLTPNQPVRVHLEPRFPENIPTQNYPTVLHVSGQAALLIPEDRNPSFDHCPALTLFGQTYRVLQDSDRYEVFLSAPGYEGAQKAKVTLDNTGVTVKFYPTVPGSSVTGNLVLLPKGSCGGAFRLEGFYNDRRSPETDPGLPGGTMSRRLSSELSGRCPNLETELQILSSRGSSPDLDEFLPGDSSTLAQGQSVTYRVTLENLAAEPMPLTGADLKLLLPDTAGAFRWQLGANAAVSDLICSQEGDGPKENWLLEEDPLQGRQMLTLHPDTGLTLPGASAAWLYVTLTYPSGDSWNAYLDALADSGTQLELHVSGRTQTVSHDLPQPDVRPQAVTCEQRVEDLQDPEHFAAGGTLTLPAGSTGARYQLQVTNHTDTAITGLTLIDVLPHVGDASPFDPAAPRNSGFGLTLDPAGPITVTVIDGLGSAEVLTRDQYTLTYSGQSSFLAQGPDWTGADHWTADPGSLQPLRAFRIQSSVEIPPEGKVCVRFTVQLPETPTGTAYNSFGCHYSLGLTGQEPEVLSESVGLEVEGLTWDLQLKKSDSTEPDRVLSGARFALYTRDTGEAMEAAAYEALEPRPELTHSEGGTTWYLSAVGSTGEDGMLTFPGLRSREYRLQEYQAPPGYLTSGGLMPVRAPGPAPAVLEITNIPGSRLPNTGGAGSQVFYLTGLGLTALATLGLLSRKRRGGRTQ